MILNRNHQFNAELECVASNQVVADSNFKYVLEIKDVPKFKDART